MKRQTGSKYHAANITVYVTGEREPPKAGEDLLRLAESTEFLDAQSAVLEADGSHILFAPSAVNDDPLAIAIKSGLIVARITITDRPSPVLPGLEPGNYYLVVDLVPSLEFDEGRWIGRVVDSGGTLRCLISSIEVTEIFSFVSSADADQSNAPPTIAIHGVSSREVSRSLGVLRDDFWLERCICAEPPMIAADPRGPQICRCFCVPIG